MTWVVWVTEHPHNDCAMEPFDVEAESKEEAEKNYYDNGGYGYVCLVQSEDEYEKEYGVESDG